MAPVGRAGRVAMPRRPGAERLRETAFKINELEQVIIRCLGLKKSSFGVDVVGMKFLQIVIALLILKLIRPGH